MSSLIFILIHFRCVIKIALQNYKISVRQPNFSVIFCDSMDVANVKKHVSLTLTEGFEHDIHLLLQLSGFVACDLGKVVVL